MTPITTLLTEGGSRRESVGTGKDLMAEQIRLLKDAGVDFPMRMLPLLREMRKATKIPIAAQPAFPDPLETIQAARGEFIEFGTMAKAEGIGYVGGCCGCNAAHIRALADGLAEAK